MEVGDKIKLCACGCGKYITYKKSHKYKKIPNRLVGHQQKWNEGLTKETDERVNKMYKEGLNKKCPICKKIFYIRNSAIKTNRTCSKKCSFIYLSNIMKGKTPKNIKILLEYIKNSKVKRINKNCLFCENKIETTIKNNKRYCSRKCYWNHLKKQGAPKHFIGYKHSEHSRKLIGKKSLVMWNKENFINRRFGLMHKYTSIKEIINLFKSGKTIKHISKETKVSQATIRRIILENGFCRKDIKERANKVIGKNTKEHRKYQIFPRQDTKIEVKIQNFLKQLGITFFTHQYMNEIEHSYQCDIFIPSMNLVIECDGNYWHKYPIGREIDKIRTSELIKKGFKILRLWEFEIKSMNLEEFKEKLK